MINLTPLLKKYDSDRFFNEVFVDKIYDPVSKLGKLNTVIDLGACTGEFSYWVYDQAEKIYAIEPIKKYYRQMEDIVEQYKLDKLKPFNLAIGSYNGRGFMNEDLKKGAAKLNGASEVSTRPTEVRTLATFMKENDIEFVDVLKIDIEGGELGVFSSSDFGKVADKIKFIIGEHGSEIEDLLPKYGFTLRKYLRGFIFER